MGSAGFNIRSIGSLWSSLVIMARAQSARSFQYPLYRITLVVCSRRGHYAGHHAVSISALSDHFGRPGCTATARFDCWRFNIRSIGSLWSSRNPEPRAWLTSAFQYPLYRITLVVAAQWQPLIAAWCFNIRSIGSLWSSGCHLARAKLNQMFQYPLYRITLVVKAAWLAPAAVVVSFNIRSIGSLWSSSVLNL